MAAVLVTARQLAQELGVSPPAVAQAKESGRLSVIPTPSGDRFDVAVAKIQWEANRKRLPPGAARVPPVSEPIDVQLERREPATGGQGGDFWEAKTRRETAEASIAELKEAELRGDLVRKAEVERALASRLVALRESLEVLADRLAAMVAAEPDASVCRRLIRDEHRKALAALAERAEPMADADEDDDGGT